MTRIDKRRLDALTKLEFFRRNGVTQGQARKRAEDERKAKEKAQAQTQAVQVETGPGDDAEIVAELVQELAYGQHTAVTNFRADHLGATRLYRSYLKRHNSYGSGNVQPQQADREDLISQIYTEIESYKPQDTDEQIQDENLRKYWGIQTWQQYRVGRNAFTRIFRGNKTVADRAEIDQDFNKVARHNELDERELEIFLQGVLSPKEYLVLSLWLMNYTAKEITADYKIPPATISRAKDRAFKKLAVIYEITSAIH